MTSACFVTASIYKLNEDPSDLSLEHHKHGGLVVSYIPKQSPFATTDLRVGDQIYAINNSIMGDSSDVDTATALLCSISGFLTLLLIRGRGSSSSNQLLQGSFASSLRTVAASKQYSEMKIGVSFIMNKDKSLSISALSDISIFVGTGLSVGDRVISINNIQPETISEVSVIIQSSIGVITLLLANHNALPKTLPGELVAKPNHNDLPLVLPGTLNPISVAHGSSSHNGLPLVLPGTLNPVSVAHGNSSHDVLPKVLPGTFNPPSLANEQALTVVDVQTEDIAEVLQSLGLGEFEESFRQNGVESAKDALLLTPADVKELGIVKIGQRNRMLNWIKESSQSSLPRASPVPASLSTSQRSGPLVQKIQGIGVHPTDVAFERPKDQHNPKRVSLAQQAATTITQTLQQSFPLDPTTTSQVLRTRVVLASDGSTSGRLWASEFGCGHAKFALLWSLASSDSTPASWSRIQKTDSGGLGFKDFGPGDVGYNAVLKMAHKSATEIISSVTSSCFTAGISSSSASERLLQHFAYGAAEELGGQAAAALFS